MIIIFVGLLLLLHSCLLSMEKPIQQSINQYAIHYNNSPVCIQTSLNLVVVATEQTHTSRLNLELRSPSMNKIEYIDTCEAPSHIHFCDQNRLVIGNNKGILTSYDIITNNKPTSVNNTIINTKTYSLHNICSFAAHKDGYAISGLDSLDNNRIIIALSVPIITEYNIENSTTDIIYDNSINKEQVLSALSLSPDKTLISAGFENGDIYIWNSTSKKLMQILHNAHNSVIIGLKWIKNNAVSAGKDNVVKIWDLEEQQCIKKFHQTNISAYDVSPDNIYVAVYGDKIQIYDIREIPRPIFCAAGKNTDTYDLPVSIRFIPNTDTIIYTKGCAVYVKKFANQSLKHTQ